jgi:peptide/nickel transport system permease protein
MNSLDPTFEVEAELDADARRSWRLRKLPPISVMVAMVILTAVIVCAIAGSQLAPYDPGTQDLTNVAQTAGGGHVIGTDGFGRDVLSRVMAGARTAFVGPLLIALGAMVIGSVLGLLAGYRGGRTDTIVMRCVEIVYSIPALLAAIVVAGILGGGYWLAVGLLTILFAPNETRLVRGATLAQRPRPYVEAAEALGLSDTRIMLRHIWPNVLPVVLANSFLTFAFGLVSLAGLAFVGIGVDPSTPDWGRMLYDGRELIFQNPWTALAPALAIILTATSVNLLGDWIFERLEQRGRLS